MAYAPTYANTVGGLITTPGYSVASQEGSPGQTMQAATRQVDPNELSQTHLANITASGSPLMQRAAALGKMTAQKRGLLNSSMAAGSAQNAVIEAAQPFALQDASAYGKVLSANQEAQQQANQLNVQQAYERDKLNTAAINRAQEFGAGNAYELGKMREAAALDTAKMREQFGLESNFELGKMREAAALDAARMREQLNIENNFDLAKLREAAGLDNAKLQLANQITKEQAQLEQGNALQKAYLTHSNELRNNYLNGWFKIQESSMTPEQKTTALSEYNATVRTWTSVLNTAYASLPGWQDQWGMVFTG